MKLTIQIAAIVMNSVVFVTKKKQWRSKRRQTRWSARTKSILKCQSSMKNKQ